MKTAIYLAFQALLGISAARGLNMRIPLSAGDSTEHWLDERQCKRDLATGELDKRCDPPPPAPCTCDTTIDASFVTLYTHSEQDCGTGGTILYDNCCPNNDVCDTSGNVYSIFYPAGGACPGEGSAVKEFSLCVQAEGGDDVKCIDVDAKNSACIGLNGVAIKKVFTQAFERE